VAVDAKVGARATVVKALLDNQWPDKIVSVRVNAATTNWFEEDVIEVVRGAGARIDTIVLPKVESAQDVRLLAMLLTRTERRHGLARAIGIEPQIESAHGLRFVEEIAEADERVESLTFGPADYAASIGSPVLSIGTNELDYPGHVWHYPMSRIVVAAKSRGLAVIDGPYGVIDDTAGLLASAKLARALGYDGKWAVHPSQIETIVDVFSPTDAEIARAQSIVERYTNATIRERLGAVAHDGELLDAASLKLAESTLRKAHRRKH